MHPGTSLALLLACSTSLVAQSLAPRFRFGLAGGGGTMEHLTNQSSLDGETDAGMFRLQFEGFGDGGIGGGLRIDSFVSDDDLFAPTFARVEASTGSLFGHVSIRVEHDRLVMPVRIGLLFHGHVLEDTTTSEEITYSSFGPQIEIAPELFLVTEPGFAWSVQSTLALGAGFTRIEVDRDFERYDSGTVFYGFELGTRIYAGPVDLGISYVLRGHEMDDSDVRNGAFVFGYDSSFEGVAVSLGVSF